MATDPAAPIGNSLRRYFKKLGSLSCQQRKVAILDEFFKQVDAIKPSRKGFVTYFLKMHYFLMSKITSSSSGSSVRAPSAYDSGSNYGSTRAFSRASGSYGGQSNFRVGKDGVIEDSFYNENRTGTTVSAKYRQGRRSGRRRSASNSTPKTVTLTQEQVIDLLTRGAPAQAFSPSGNERSDKKDSTDDIVNHLNQTFETFFRESKSQVLQIFSSACQETVMGHRLGRSLMANLLFGDHYVYNRKGPKPAEILDVRPELFFLRAHRMFQYGAFLGIVRKRDVTELNNRLRRNLIQTMTHLSFSTLYQLCFSGPDGFQRLCASQVALSRTNNCETAANS